MTGPRSWIAGLALLLAASSAQAQSPVEVDIATARSLAVQLIESGQPGAAQALLQTLLAHDADDPGLLLALSRAERDMAHFDSAARHARRAFRLAAPGGGKFQAARAVAQALASDGKRGRAQIWLRRAARQAPNDRALALVRREFRYVRSRNPVTLSFNGSISPNDNINDAPTTNRIVIGGLTFENPAAQPISGVEFRFQAEATYRLPATERRQSEFTFAYAGRRVVLGEEAEAIDPTLDNALFRSDGLSVGWATKYLLPDRERMIDSAVTVFADWNAGRHSQTGLRAALGYTFPLAEGRLRLGAEFEHADRVDRPIRSSRTRRLMADWSIGLENGDRLGAGMTLSDTDSASEAVAHGAAELRLSYHWADPQFGAHWGGALEYRRALFDQPLYSVEPREDHAVTVRLSAEFREMQFYGFAPVVELRREVVRSNISRFDTRNTGISLSVRSTF